jgi:hypothetical protein
VDGAGIGADPVIKVYPITRLTIHKFDGGKRPLANKFAKETCKMTKKLVLMVILTISTTALVFSNENRISLGFTYGNFFEKRTDGGVDLETRIGSPGFDLSLYHFWDNFGFFQNHVFLFPSTVTTNVDGYDYFFSYRLITGPAYKIAFTGKLNMNFGVGLSLGPILGEINDKRLVQFNLGIGGDIGISYSLNRYAYINIGGTASYHFFNLTWRGTGTYKEESDGDREEIFDTERSKNYNMAEVRPYIRIGFLMK